MNQLGLLSSKDFQASAGACMHAQSCWTWPGFSVLGVFLAGVLEWVAISSSRGYSRPKDQTCISCTGFFNY